MMLAEPRRTPYHWWGDAWSSPIERSLDELVEQGVVSIDIALRLVEVVSAGESVVVVAARSGAGKSTVAHSLTMHIPNTRNKVYVRGFHDQMQWASTIETTSLTILVNEIGDHLPVYLYGNALARAAQLVAAGAQLIGTAHPPGLERLLHELDQFDTEQCSPLSLVKLDDHMDPPARVAQVIRITNPGKHVSLPDRSGRIRC